MELAADMQAFWLNAILVNQTAMAGKPLPPEVKEFGYGKLALEEWLS